MEPRSTTAKRHWELIQGQSLPMRPAPAATAPEAPDAARAVAPAGRFGLLPASPLAIPLLVLALALGAYLRLAPALAADFPVGDGGLFYTMTDDLIRARAALPLFTSYNQDHIPFAYPPLGFYLLAALASVGQLSLLDLLRIVPPLLCILTIPAFSLLARAVLDSEDQVAFATLAYACSPLGFLDLVSGGGLTRSLGLLFALLALQQAALLYRRRAAGYVPTAALCAALSVLSHPNTGWFTACGFVVLYLCYDRTRRGALASLALALLVAGLTAPWWATVLARHGPAPLLAAFQSGQPPLFPTILLLWVGRLLDPSMTLVGVLALLGFFVCLRDRRFFLPAWMLVILTLNVRQGHTYAAVAATMLFAVALDRLVLPAFGGLPARRPTPAKTDRIADVSTVGSPVVTSPTSPNRDVRQRDTSGARAPSPALARWHRGSRDTETIAVASETAAARVPGLLNALLTVIVLLAILPGALAALPPWSPLRVLPAETRLAMGWIGAETPSDSRFLVFAADGTVDGATTDWFPALARRVALTDRYGAEWLSGAEYARRGAQIDSLAACASQEASCLERWARDVGLSFTHVYLGQRADGVGLARSCCPVLRGSLAASPEYALVLDGPGGAVFARRAGP